MNSYSTDQNQGKNNVILISKFFGFCKVCVGYLPFNWPGVQIPPKRIERGYITTQNKYPHLTKKWSTYIFEK